MFCPYTVNRHLAQQTTYEYDESGNVTMNQVIEHNTAEFVECQKEKCGAYKEGQCKYYQS